ncbi:peptide transporter PTR2B [Coprinopsis sp. MPI-PUGE-AT-0042]|nr:peptide transporter PTR2B [Coprinopsis sp. MPI-PUGE-AT-0042]
MSEKADEKSSVDRARSVEEKYSVDLNGPNRLMEGSEGVTHHEFETLRHVSDRFPVATWMIVVVEFAERWTYYGTVNIFNNYIRQRLPNNSTTGAVVGDAATRARGVAGALGKGQKISFAIRTFNTFLVYCTPWIGAIIADTMWGRYKTILVFAVVCAAGHIVLVGSASPASLRNPEGAMGLLIVSIIIIGVGAGCIKSNVAPMVAEQYQGKMRKKTLKSGEVVIVSPDVTIQSIYLWFYAAINFGSCGAISASFLAKNHGYWAAYLVPTGIFCIVPFVLMAGKKRYVMTPPRGSILLETLRVIRLSLGPAWSFNPIRTYKNCKNPDFWDSAKPSTYGDNVPSSITWDDPFVGEVARTVKACEVLMFMPFFWLCYSQIDGNLGTTAAGMQLNGTPNDLIQNLNPVGIIIMVPIFDFLIYPFLRRHGIDFTPIRRIYTGFLVAGLAMVYSSVLQSYIAKRSPCAGLVPPSECETADKEPNPAPINVWIVAGPYIMVGMAEIFSSVTSNEYAFTKAPVRMKSVVTAFSQFQNAISSILNFALVEVNTEQKFVWLYGSFAVVAWVIGTIFFLLFRRYDRKEHDLNAIGRGPRVGFVDEARASDQVDVPLKS